MTVRVTIAADRRLPLQLENLFWRGVAYVYALPSHPKRGGLPQRSWAQLVRQLTAQLKCQPNPGDE